MSKPLIVDLHLDLAWDAIYWNRDLTLTAEQVREQERREPPQVAPGHTCGTCTTTFPELRQGGVGVILSTIMSRVQTRSGRMKDGLRTQEQCIGMGRGHLAYYQAMARRGHLKSVHGWADLEEAIEAWKDPKPDTPIYHVLSMESADPIADPGDVEFWWDAGLRVVGPAHFGDNTYIHGTGTEGGLKPPAPALYRALRQAGIILDITHMADQAVWESLEIWDGPIVATHCSARALIKGQRHLTDDMIREVIRRGWSHRHGLLARASSTRPSNGEAGRPSTAAGASTAWTDSSPSSNISAIWPAARWRTSPSGPTWTADSEPR